MAFSDQQLQQTVNVVAEKEPTGINENGNSNGNCNGNGNGNESPHNEESDLLERYWSFVSTLIEMLPITTVSTIFLIRYSL